MLLPSHFRLAFMVPLVIKPAADFSNGGDGVVCLVTVSIIYVIFACGGGGGGIASPETNSQ